MKCALPTSPKIIFSQKQPPTYIQSEFYFDLTGLLIYLDFSDFLMFGVYPLRCLGWRLFFIKASKILFCVFSLSC